MLLWALEEQFQAKFCSRDCIKNLWVVIYIICPGYLARGILNLFLIENNQLLRRKILSNPLIILPFIIET